VQQQFTQGNLTTTNNPLDLALNGGGFFRLSQEGAISYTRNGQFHIDNGGYIINDLRSRLTGYPVAASGTKSPLPTRSSCRFRRARLRRWRAATRSPEKCGRCSISTRATSAAGGGTPFDFSDPETYNFSTALDRFRHPRRSAQS
jgi:flagellar hook protein FlgE